MARRGRPDDSSLELLLDTICNTFGGVLFLAMLVSLLLTQTQRKVDESVTEPCPAISAADLVRLDTRAEDAARKVESLAKQVRQARRAAADLTVPNSEALTASMEAAEESVEKDSARRVQLLTLIAAQQAASARASRAAAADERERQKLATAAEQSRRRLAGALAVRDELVASAIRIRDDLARRSTVQTTGKAPRMRETEKNECGLLLRYGRLYRMKDLQDGGLVVNDRDFAVTPGLLLNSAKAKPHAGLDVSSVEGRDTALRRVLADFPPARWYACLVVYPDSFEEYLTVKNWLIERGYEYKIMPTTDGVVDRGGSDVFVQ